MTQTDWLILAVAITQFLMGCWVGWQVTTIRARRQKKLSPRIQAVQPYFSQRIVRIPMWDDSVDSTKGIHHFEPDPDFEYRPYDTTTDPIL